MLRPASAKQAVGFLTCVGVNIQHHKKIEPKEKLGDDRSTRLADGIILDCDFYVPATGEKPMMGYVPYDCLDEGGCFETNPSSLRIAPRIHASRDAAD